MTRTLRMGRAAARKAFTLIELIVVIVIIGILAAVAAVSYNSFIGNANETAAQAAATQFAKVIQADSAFQNDAVDGNFLLSTTAFADLPAAESSGVASTVTAATASTPAGHAITIGDVTPTGASAAVPNSISFVTDGTTCAITPGSQPGASMTVNCG